VTQKKLESLNMQMPFRHDFEFQQHNYQSNTPVKQNKRAMMALNRSPEATRQNGAFSGRIEKKLRNTWLVVNNEC